MAPGGLWARAFPAVFWQTMAHKGVFSTGTESGDITGFPGIGRQSEKANGARIGLVFTQGLLPLR